MPLVIKRVGVSNAKPEPITGSDLPGNTVDYTVLNTHATKSAEIVASSSASWGSGFPLMPGAAWSGRCSGAEKMWVIAQDATVVSVAVLGVAVP